MIWIIAIDKSTSAAFLCLVEMWYSRMIGQLYMLKLFDQQLQKATESSDGDCSSADTALAILRHIWLASVSFHRLSCLLKHHKHVPHQSVKQITEISDRSSHKTIDSY